MKKSVILCSILLLSFLGLAFSEVVTLCDQPAQLSTIPIGVGPQYQYSPAVCFQITGLAPSESYVFKFWLLETITPLEDRPNCAVPTNNTKHPEKPTGYWCEKTITFTNTATDTQKTLWIADTTETLVYPQYRALVRLYNSKWAQVAVLNQIIPGTNKRPITLDALPPARAILVNSTLYFTAHAAFVNKNESTPGPITYSIINAPPGANFNPTTGLFVWTPHQLGRYENVIITAKQGAGTAQDPVLFDSAKMTFNVVKFKGIPTPTPTPDVKQPFAKLTGIDRVDDCRFLVKVYLRNFPAGTYLNATSTGNLIDCATGQRKAYNWKSNQLLKIRPDGTLFVQLIHRDYGKYTYYFSDAKNRTYTLPVSYDLSLPITA